MRDTQTYDMQLASSQLQALVSHLRDATHDNRDPQTARRFHQAQALLYEVAETLGVNLDSEDLGSRVADREARSAAVTDREARSAAVSGSAA